MDPGGTPKRIRVSRPEACGHEHLSTRARARVPPCVLRRHAAVFGGPRTRDPAGDSSSEATRAFFEKLDCSQFALIDFAGGASGSKTNTNPHTTRAGGRVRPCQRLRPGTRRNPSSRNQSGASGVMRSAGLIT